MTSYTRVSDNIFDSSLWSDGSYDGVCALKLFLAILGEARRQHGKVRRLTVAKAARVGAIPLERAKEAIDRLTGPDVDDSSGIEEGRRLLPDPEGAPNDFIVTNWEAYGREFTRANDAERKRRQRERDGKRDASVTQSRSGHYEEKLKETTSRVDTRDAGIEPRVGKPISPEAVRLARMLLDGHILRDPLFVTEHDRQTKAERWSRDFDLLLRKDGRTPEQVEAVIRFCLADPFEQANVQSGAKLRKRFPQLLAKSSTRRPASTGSRPFVAQI